MTLFRGSVFDWGNCLHKAPGRRRSTLLETQAQGDIRLQATIFSTLTCCHTRASHKFRDVELLGFYGLITIQG